MFGFMAFEPSAHLSLSVPDINVGAHVGGPFGSPLLGINDWIPDALENWWYGRDYGGGGLWFEYFRDGIWTAWDANGNQVDFYAQTTEANSTLRLTPNRSIGFDNSYQSGGATVFLRLIPSE
jgi:hypothetical protein